MNTNGSSSSTVVVCTVAFSRCSVVVGVSEVRRGIVKVGECLHQSPSLSDNPQLSLSVPDSLGQSQTLSVSPRYLTRPRYLVSPRLYREQSAYVLASARMCVQQFQPVSRPANPRPCLGQS